MRLLVVPAAGLGMRLNSAGPKLLHRIDGRAMIDYIFDLYVGYVDRVVVVVHPSFAKEAEEHCAGLPIPTRLFLQERADGMLPAICIPAAYAERLPAEQVWITWCDQIGIRPQTVARLAAVMKTSGDVAMAFPTSSGEHPYIHFKRDVAGRIVSVLQRREGDVMPELGESDAGLFALRPEVYLEDLHRFVTENAVGCGTGEANFLPFIPWLASRKAIATFPVCDRIEALGVNTPADQRTMEAYLRERA